MPSKSKSQQRFFGMVDAYQKGELSDKEVSQDIKDAAKGMTHKEVKKFAKTKHKGLPERVDEENKLSPKKQYEINKNTRCGDTIVCPVCGTSVTKRQHQQAFCSNNCKNQFWNQKGDRHRQGYYRKYNMTHPDRYNFLIANAINDDEARHWEAVKAYAEDKDFRRYVRDCELNSDGAWDEHNCNVAIEDLYDNYLGMDAYDDNFVDSFIDEQVVRNTLRSVISEMFD